MTSSLHGPYGLGYTRVTMPSTIRSKALRQSESKQMALVPIVLATREHEVGFTIMPSKWCVLLEIGLPWLWPVWVLWG